MDWFGCMASLLAQAAPVTVKVGETAAWTPLQRDALIVAAVIAASFVAGHFIAEGLKLRDLSLRIGTTLCTLLVGITICILGWPPKLGIDLSGGVVLVYEVDKEQMRSQELQTALGQVQQQLGSMGEGAVTAGVSPAGKIEIIATDKTLVPTIESKLEPLGLKAAGRRSEGDKTILDYDPPPGRPLKLDDLVNAINKRINPGGVLELTVRPYGENQIEIIIPDLDAREVAVVKHKISTAGKLEFRIVADSNQPDDRRLIRLAQQSQGREVYDRGKLIGRWVKIGRSEVALYGGAVVRPNGTEILVKTDPYNVTGKDLDNSYPGMDGTHREVMFTLTTSGGKRFGGLTGSNVVSDEQQQEGRMRKLGIVLDDTLLSAPNIKSKITDHGQISGGFDENEGEVKFLVDLFNAGSLPASFSPEPISEQNISAQLGEDTIRQGSQAMIASTVAVLVFMLVYYRFAGAVADVAVVMNMVLAVALMMVFRAAFTLPGLAGLVLTVGMAVDANVLIYERMREEAARGASLRMTIRNGFSRAMSTIIDSNLTTVISAVVLYKVGTDQVKGFAVSLILGLIVSLYTAIVVARLIFDIVERKRWLTSFRMMQFIGETKIDFVKWRGPAIAVSSVLIAIGAVAVWERGSDLLDIDFTGGVSVQVKFNEKQDIKVIREKLSKVLSDDLAVSSVGTSPADRDRQFKIDTSEPDINAVKSKLQEVFGTELASYSMKFGAVEPDKAPVSPLSTGGAVPESTSPAPPAKTPAEPTKNPLNRRWKSPPAPASATPPAATTPPGKAPKRTARANPATPPSRTALGNQTRRPSRTRPLNPPRRSRPLCEGTAPLTRSRCEAARLGPVLPG